MIKKTNFVLKPPEYIYIGVQATKGKRQVIATSLGSLVQVVFAA